MSSSSPSPFHSDMSRSGESDCISHSSHVEAQSESSMGSSRSGSGLARASSFNPEAAAFTPGHDTELVETYAQLVENSVAEEGTSFTGACHSNDVNGREQPSPQLPIGSEIFGQGLTATNLGNVNEGLGLPRPDTAERCSTSPHASSLPQNLPIVLMKLFGRASRQPFVTETMAHHLGSKVRAPWYDRTAVTAYAVSSLMAASMPKPEDQPGIVDCWPSAPVSHEILRNPTDQGGSSSALAPEELTNVPTGPRALQNPPIRLANPRWSRGQNKRFRAGHRGRRADQGPEPSAADIYPEDANWESSLAIQASRNIQRLQAPVVSRVHVPAHLRPHSENDLDGPSPAENSQRAVQTRPRVSSSSSTYDIFKNHSPPTTADMNALDADVYGITKSSSCIKIAVLFDIRGLRSESVSTVASDASNSLQKDKYGLTYHGVGLSDPWSPPMPNLSAA